ncbi:hypothetical protein DT23_10150 [Thioclava indica]|uniref:Uncharacterized protein n=1 Tax=Thioclava indica TaxID=1353528 RepID=A0A074JUA2_9RHOB|nr:hypothetical protein DT23_10150 [Thioclava indica]
MQVKDLDLITLPETQTKVMLNLVNPDVYVR